MPTYNYKCKDCGLSHSIFQKMSDNPITVCPKCGGNTQRKISGGTGLIFKGSGFYLTDYGKSDNNSKSDSTKYTQKEGKSNE